METRVLPQGLPWTLSSVPWFKIQYWLVSRMWGLGHEVYRKNESTVGRRGDPGIQQQKTLEKSSTNESKGNSCTNILKDIIILLRQLYKILSFVRFNSHRFQFFSVINSGVWIWYGLLNGFVQLSIFMLTIWYYFWISSLFIYFTINIINSMKC